MKQLISNDSLYNQIGMFHEETKTISCCTVVVIVFSSSQQLLIKQKFLRFYN